MSVLVICEKPSVARSVAPVLGSEKKCSGYTEGNGYTVSWCYGHIAGLKYPDDYGNSWAGKWNFTQLPMIPDEWKFVIIESAKEQYKVLKKLMNSSEITEIVCATDADREGECIFRYVYFLSGCKKPVKRLWISSLEESEIRKGFDNLKSSSEYDNLFSAGFCRAKADWLVGMNASRLFSCRYNQGFNVGRVQTPTLAMIVNRDNDIKNFVKQKYFTIDLDCGDFLLSSERVDNEAEADQAMKDIAGKQVSPVLIDGLYWVKITEISPKDYSRMYNVSVTDGQSAMSVKYSALSYVKNKLNDADQNLVNVCKAMYLYNKSMTAYKN